jgi:predicted ferric reductase
MSGEILWYASRSTGVVAQVLLTAVLVLGLLTAGRVAGTFTRATMARLHRSLTLAVLVFTAVHIVTAIVDGYVDLSPADAFLPFGAGFDPFWIALGAVAVDLLLAIGVTSALRSRLPHKLWRIVHLAAYALWPIAMLHGWGTSGGDASSVWMLTVNLVCVASVLAALTFRLTHRDDDGRARRTANAKPPRTDHNGWVGAQS